MESWYFKHYSDVINVIVKWKLKLYHTTKKWKIKSSVHDRWSFLVKIRVGSGDKCNKSVLCNCTPLHIYISYVKHYICCVLHIMSKFMYFVYSIASQVYKTFKMAGTTAKIYWFAKIWQSSIIHRQYTYMIFTSHTHTYIYILALTCAVHELNQ